MQLMPLAVLFSLCDVAALGAEAIPLGMRNSNRTLTGRQLIDGFWLRTMSRTLAASALDATGRRPVYGRACRGNRLAAPLIDGRRRVRVK